MLNARKKVAVELFGVQGFPVGKMVPYEHYNLRRKENLIPKQKRILDLNHG